MVLSWNHSKSTPCLLVRHKHRHTNHHAAASLAFKVVPVPLGVTHDASATRPATSTTAPPCPSPTRRARWTGRAVAYEAGFASLVVVVASSSVVRLGSTGISRKAAPTRKRSGPSRIATRGFPERSASGDLGTCLVAFPRCDAAAGQPGGHGQFSCLGRFSTTSGQASNHGSHGTSWPVSYVLWVFPVYCAKKHSSVSDDATLHGAGRHLFFLSSFSLTTVAHSLASPYRA